MRQAARKKRGSGHPKRVGKSGPDDRANVPAFGVLSTPMGAHQPARRSFKIDGVRMGRRLVSVQQRDLFRRPFGALVHFEKAADGAQIPVLIVPPHSGHFPFLLRDVAVELLVDHDVYVADWFNARHVPAAAGRFGLADVIDDLMEMIRMIGSDVVIVALCQGGIPALAATALLEQAADAMTPRALVLVAAPVDPDANKTRVVRHIEAHPPEWFETHVLSTVGDAFPGAGRLVYPAWIQLSGLMGYLGRHLAERGELFEKLAKDDGADPDQVPFFEAYSAIMDLPAELFLDTVRLVFHERALMNKSLKWRDGTVDCAAITKTALMTIEGARDDVAAPGQTVAAHDLCKVLAPAKQCHLLVEDCGHFSTFYGQVWRNHIAPRIREFVASQRS